jgi:predicted neutral ceramidase superfamily lipid hydrolase
MIGKMNIYVINDEIFSLNSCGFHAGRIYLSIDDIIFPSLLINFCRLFDIGNNIYYRIYYIQVFISYIISFFVSYIIMIITKRDQLSSIIIYPFIILSTIMTGIIRGEFRKLLRGTLTTFEERQKNERRNSF